MSHERDVHVLPSLERTMVVFPKHARGRQLERSVGRSHPRAGVRKHHESRSGCANGIPIESVARPGGLQAHDTMGRGRSGRFWNPQTRVPCSAPPFGELVAVDATVRSPCGFRSASSTISRRVDSSEDRRAEHRRFDRDRRRAWSSSPARLTDVSGRSTREAARGYGRPTLEVSGHATPMTFMGRNGRQDVW